MNDSAIAPQLAKPALNHFSLIANAQSIAIIGASKTEDLALKLTGRPLNFLQRHGFKGRIIAVNPKYTDIDGIPCYPSIAEVPGAVDVVAIFLPKERVSAAVEACGKKGVKAALVFSSGFGESGEEGRKAQLELVTLAHRYGMRIVGPNASAVVSVANRMILTFLTAFGQQDVVQGNIA